MRLVSRRLMLPAAPFAVRWYVLRAVPVRPSVEADSFLIGVDCSRFVDHAQDRCYPCPSLPPGDVQTHLLLCVLLHHVLQDLLWCKQGV